MDSTIIPETTPLVLITYETNVAACAFYTLAFFITFILSIYHGLQVYQDLYTKERASVGHRRSKPDVNKWYKIINILTLLSLFCFSFSLLSGTLGFFGTSVEACDASVTMIIVWTQIGKSLMYIVFLARLYTVYEKSAYSYPYKCIACFFTVLVVYGAAVTIFVGLFVSAYIYKYGDEAYPNFCNGGGGPQFLIVGAFMVLQDIAVAVGFLIAFMLPLKKTLKAIEGSMNDSKVTRKIVYAGTKTTVLTGTAMFSTLFITIAVIMTGIGIFQTIDPIINILCMMFMTAYYKDTVWYQRCCRCCICCCNKLGRTDTSDAVDDQSGAATSRENEPTRTEITTTNAASSTGQTATVKSVDTMSQLRVAGGNVQIVYDNNGGGNKPIQEITPEPPINNDEEP